MTSDETKIQQYFMPPDRGNQQQQQQQFNSRASLGRVFLLYEWFDLLLLFSC
jgi:hypothetical protein